MIFIQGFLLEGLRFLGEWRSLLFGVLIIIVMIVRPSGFLKSSLFMRPQRSKSETTTPKAKNESQIAAIDEVHHA